MRKQNQTARFARVVSALLGMLGAALSAAGSTQAQAALERDAPVVVTIRPDAPAILTYAAEAGEVISITARALPDADDRAIDTVLAVIGPDDRKIAYNDDTHTPTPEGIDIQRDAQITDLRLPVAGTYTLRVDAFNGLSTGQAEVVLTAGDVFEADITTDNGTTRIRAQLPAGLVYAYTWAADGPFTLSVRDTSGTLDPVLRVLAEDGTIIGFNDDHHSADTTLNTFDARLTVDTGADEALTVQMWDFAGAAGSFALEIVAGR